MTGTTRTHASRPCNKRVNQEKEWKRRRSGDRVDKDGWGVRRSAFRREFDYTHSTQSGLPVARERQSRRGASAAKRKLRKLAREDKLLRWAAELPEESCEWSVETEHTITETQSLETETLRPPTLEHQAQDEDKMTQDQDYALVMKFGCVTVRLPNTYLYNNQWYGTGECLVRYINGRWLVLPCDLVMDDLSYLYSDFAWEDGSIGFLTEVSVPQDPLCENIQGSYLNWLDSS